MFLQYFCQWWINWFWLATTLTVVIISSGFISRQNMRDLFFYFFYTYEGCFRLLFAHIFFLLWHVVLVYYLTTKIISIQSAIIQFNSISQKFIFYAVFFSLFKKRLGRNCKTIEKKKKNYKTEIGIKAKQNIFCEYYEKYLSWNKKSLQDITLKHMIKTYDKSLNCIH